MRTLVSLLLTVITFASVAVAQSKKEKVEIGVQSTSLTLVHPDFSFDGTQAGIGGRLAYNFNRSIAAEAEINFFPQKQFILTADGNAIQAQFGVKLGKRFEKFGLFGKIRPGFLSVVEFYISPRWMARFDIDDTVIRYGEIRIAGFTSPSYYNEERRCIIFNFLRESVFGFRVRRSTKHTSLNPLLDLNLRETTCQFILLFAIGGALLVFPEVKRMWDLSDRRPSATPPESHRPLTVEDHRARSLDE
jgi:hypothetical protein